MSRGRCRKGITGLDQEFRLEITKTKLLQKFDVNLIVKSRYNGKIFHIKLNNKKMTYYEAVEYSACVAAILESKNLDIDYNYGLPCGDTILLTRDLISLTRLPHYVMCDPDYYLNPGDEIFVQCRTLNVGFYHSGIYAGRGKVFHFMADLSPDDSLGNVMFGPGRVHSDNWIDFVYSNLDYEPNSDITPIIYKVIYPLAVRSGRQIVSIARQIQKSQKKLIYDIRRNNCQHFSSYCSVGQPWSYDMDSGFKRFACSFIEKRANAQQVYQYPQQYYYNQQYYPQQYYPQQYYPQQEFQQQQFQQQPQQQQFQQQPQQQQFQQQPQQQQFQQQQELQQQQFTPQPQNPLPPKKVSTEEEIAFDLPPPSPSRFTSTKAVQPISRTRLVNRPSSTTRRVVSASHVNRTPQVTRGVQRPSAPAPRRSVPAPAPVSHLSSGKRDPNSFFLSCCKHKNVAKTCESRCNFDVLTKKILTGMFLGTDSCPQSNGLDLFSCAAQDGDHTPCCRRNKVHNTSAGEKCLNFCRMTPDHNFQADASYLPCWAVLNKIKTCFKDAITN